MVMMSIIELKPGTKLAKDVHTPLGGLLLSKGKVILPRDLEILRAFLVQTVEVDMNTGVLQKEDPHIARRKSRRNNYR